MVYFLAVIGAAVLGMGVGAFWYSPAGFGKMWMRLIGLTQKDLEKAKDKGMGKAYGITFISLLVMSYILSVFVNNGGVMGGLKTGFLLWLGFVATVSIGGVLWRDEPWALYILNTTHWLVVILIMGVINGVWI
jgi:hypothetical protein